jgi:uncharacterized protein YjiS (DUF1127 family)
MRRLAPQPAVRRVVVTAPHGQRPAWVVQHQLELNDHLLKDIGLTRVDFHYAASRRFLQHWQ